MSIASTHMVTREFALSAITIKMSQMNDIQLEDLLEIAIHNRFYNFRIVSELELEQEKSGEYGGRWLDDLNDLPEYNYVG